MTVAPLVGRTLAPHEREFVRRVMLHLRDVPKPARSEVERSIVEHLMDRPATNDETTLWDELGMPGTYARTAREDHGLGEERTDRYARWTAIDRMHRWVGGLAVVALVAAVSAGGLTLRWWLRWEAKVYSPLFGICLDYQAGRGCTDIERREAAGRSEAIVDYSPGGGFDVALQPINASDRTIRIIAVDAPVPLNSLYHFDRVLLDLPTTRSQEALVFAPYQLLPRTDGPYRWVVRFRFSDDCRAFGTAGSGTSFDELVIHYEALGRRRTTTLTLPSRVSIVMRADCPTG